MGFLSRLFGRSSKATTNPALLKAMRRFVGDPTPDARRNVYKTLLKSNLLVICAEKPAFAPDSGEMAITTEEDIAIQLYGLTDSNGMVGAVAFTDLNAMLKWMPQIRNYLAIPAETFLPMLTESNFVGLAINESSPEKIWLSRPEYTTLARGSIPEYHTDRVSLSHLKGERLGIRPSTVEIPLALTQVLLEQSQLIPEIESAYLLDMIIGESPPKVTIGLRCSKQVTDNRKKEITQAIGKQTESVFEWKQDLLFIFMESPEMIQIAGKCPAFFIRFREERT